MNWLKKIIRKPFKRAICEAFSDGKIDSKQLHILAAKFDKAKMFGGLIAICLLATFGAMAQSATNNLPTNPVDALSQATSWITSVDTNKTWLNSPVDIWTGANFQSGLQTSSELGGSYDAWSTSTNTALAPELLFRNAGIAGTLVSAQAGIGWSIFHYDLKLTPYASGGYSVAKNCGTMEAGVRLKKKVANSSSVGLGLSYPYYFHGPNTKLPSLTTFLTWTF